MAFNRALAEGDAFLAQNSLTEALASYDRAAEANPVSPAPAVKRGNVYLAQGDTERALAEYNAAIEMDSTYALAYFQIGELLKSQGDINGALEQYRRTLRVDPAYADAYIQIGGTYQDSGDLAKRRGELQRGAQGCGQRPACSRLGHHSSGQPRIAARQHRPRHRPLSGGTAGRSPVRRFLLAIGPGLSGAGAVRSGAGTV